MKKISIFFIFLALIFAIYYGLSSKREVKNLNVSITKPEKRVQKVKIPTIVTNPLALTKNPAKKEKEGKFSQIEKINYFQKIRDTIKDQWKELEDCEAEFDLNFGDLIAMGPDQAMDYLNDTTNLDNFLEKISSFNMTTPSSAVMLKELAEPISGFVDGKEILATVGYVKRCRVQEKAVLLSILFKLKNKDQRTALATLAFFENENSTLTYPDILFEQVWEIKTFLEDYGLKESDFPEIAQITKEFFDFKREIASKSPKEKAGFNPATQKADYDFAVKLRPRIKSLLNKIKKRFI